MTSMRELINLSESRLDEAGAGPSRIVKHIREGEPFFIVSAMRANLPYRENLDRTNALRSKLDTLPVSYIKTEGEFLEDGSEHPSRELSFFVMGGNEDSTTPFIQLLHYGKLFMKRYQQDAIMCGNGEYVYLLFADGSTEKVGNSATFSVQKIRELPGFSAIKGRKFSFTHDTEVPTQYGIDKAAPLDIKNVA